MVKKTEDEELEEVIRTRRCVICEAILQNARTPEQIRKVAASLGAAEAEYSDDPVVLKVLADYWAGDECE